MDQRSEAEHSDASSEDLPIEHKCELCGTEFVTPTSLKIHRLKCVKMHKELQQNRQITPEVVSTPEPEVVKSAAPEVPVAKPEVPAPKPEIPAPKPEVPAPKPEVQTAKPEVVQVAKPEVRKTAPIISTIRRKQDFACQFCNDEFRSETSLKMHKLICSVKKKTETISKLQTSETDQPKNKLVTVHSVTSEEKIVHKQKLAPIATSSPAKNISKPEGATPETEVVSTPEPEMRTPTPVVENVQPPSRPSSALLCHSRKVDPIRDFFKKQENKLKKPSSPISPTNLVDNTKKGTKRQIEETLPSTPPPLLGIKIKVPKPATAPPLQQPEVDKPEVNIHPEVKKLQQADKFQYDSSDNDSNSILAQHFKSAKTQKNIEIAEIPKKSPLKLKISLSNSGTGSSSSNNSPALPVEKLKKIKQIKNKKKIPKISILPPKPMQKMPQMLGAFVTKPTKAVTMSKGQEIHHKRKIPPQPSSDVPKLKVPKLKINIGRLKSTGNESTGSETNAEEIPSNSPKIKPCKVSLQNLEMPPVALTKNFLNIKKVKKTMVKRLLGPARKRGLKVKELFQPGQEMNKPEAQVALPVPEEKKLVPKLSLNIKDIPKETLEFLESPAESSPNSILKRRLNIKPIEPKSEVKMAPKPEVKAPAPVITKKKLNIKPVEQPEVVKIPPPETEIMKKPAAPITKKKLNIKPIQDLSTNSGYSTNLEPLPPLPLPFNSANKKIIMKNIPKSSHQPEKRNSNIENKESGKPSSMAPLPVKKLTIKDVMPPEQLEKPEKSGKVGKPVISGSKPESSAVDPKKLDSRIVKPLSIKLNQSTPEVKKQPEVSKTEVKKPEISKPEEAARPALKLSLRNLKQKDSKSTGAASNQKQKVEEPQKSENSPTPNSIVPPRKRLNIKPIEQSEVEATKPEVKKLEPEVEKSAPIVPSIKIKLPPPPKPKRTLLNILTGLTKNLPQVEDPVFKIPDVPPLVLPKLEEFENDDNKNDIIADHMELTDALKIVGSKVENIEVEQEIELSPNEIGPTIVSRLIQDLIDNVVSNSDGGSEKKPKILKPITLKVHNVQSGVKKVKKPKFKVIRVSATAKPKFKRSG